MPVTNMLSWQRPRSPSRGSCQRTQIIIVAFQYGLLVFSGIDSAGAMYLLLGPGNEVTIAGASPILTAVSRTSDSNELLKAEIRWTRRPYQSHIYCSIRSCLGGTSKLSHLHIATRGTFCVLRA